MAKWVLLDFETTGLEDNCDLLEVAAHHVKKRSLELAGPGLDMCLVQPEPPEMEEGARRLHEKSGLLAEHDALRAGVIQGQVPAGCVVNYEQLDSALHDYLYDVSSAPRSILLVGNTVSYDWRLVKLRLPRSFALLHHRVVDVSVFRTQWSAWCGELVRGSVAHRARADLLMSLEGLRWQRAVIQAGGLVTGLCPDDGFARSVHLKQKGDVPL